MSPATNTSPATDSEHFSRDGLIKYLREHPGAQRPAISEHFAYPPRNTLNSALRHLVKEDRVLRRIGRAHSYRYFIAEDAPEEPNDPGPDESVCDRIVAFLREHPGSRRPQIRQAIVGVKVGSFSSALRDAFNRNLLRRTGKYKYYRYFVADGSAQPEEPEAAGEQVLARRGRPRKDEGAPRGPASTGNATIDAAIAALEIRRDALNDAIRLLRELSKGNH